jgi:hypothetical protein
LAIIICRHALIVRQTLRYCLWMATKPEQSAAIGSQNEPMVLSVVDWGWTGPEVIAPPNLDGYAAAMWELLAEDPDTLWARCYIGVGPFGSHLELQASCRRVDGTLAIDRLIIEPGVDHPNGALVTDDLRLVRLHELARRLQGLVQDGTQSDWGDSALGDPPMPPRDWVTGLARRPGRQGRSDLDYARVAAHYVQNLSSATPLKDLAKQLNFSTSQVRNLLYEARRRGLLTAAPKGKSGGALTERARALIGTLPEEDE